MLFLNSCYILNYLLRQNSYKHKYWIKEEHILQNQMTIIFKNLISANCGKLTNRSKTKRKLLETIIIILPYAHNHVLAYCSLEPFCAYLINYLHI